MALRYYTKFSNATLTDEFVFPKNLYSFSFRQPLRTANANVVGKHYGIRLIGTGSALKDFGEVTIRFLIFNDTIRDEMDSKLFSFGQGYLHTSDSKKAKAELTAMPQVDISWDRPGIMPVVLTFKLYEDLA